MDYSEKLKDPRWQKKRLKILERDLWTCQICGDTESTLNVHHMRYFPKTEPWDYPGDMLNTLCEYCHSVETGDIEAFRKRIGISASGKFFCDSLNRLANAFDEMPICHVPEVVASAICWVMEDEGTQMRIIREYFEYLGKKRKKEEKTNV